MKIHSLILPCLMSWAMGATHWPVEAAPPVNPVVTDDWSFWWLEDRCG